MTESLRWGILGTGGIAQKFGGQLVHATRGRLHAVGSRRTQSADLFAEQFGGRPYGSYEQLLEDRDVDAVYISLPNTLHDQWAVRSLNAGKHVLCEKPIASTAERAEKMFAVAQQAQRVLVEAFMYRCHPGVQELLKLVRDGAVGEVRLIRTNFTFQRPDNAGDIRYQPQLAGGSIMDVGCYCVNLARAVADSEPVESHAFVHRHHTGVDDYAAGALAFENGALCTFTCGMTVQADRTAYVGGSEGFLAVDTPWFSEGKLVLCRDGDDCKTIQTANPRNQYALEADHFADVVIDGASPVVDAKDTIGNMRVLDQLRESAGLTLTTPAFQAGPVDPHSRPG